jgi:hypothetical protein
VAAVSFFQFFNEIPDNIESQPESLTACESMCVYDCIHKWALGRWHLGQWTPGQWTPEAVTYGNNAIMYESGACPINDCGHNVIPMVRQYPRIIAGHPNIYVPMADNAQCSSPRFRFDYELPLQFQNIPPNGPKYLKAAKNKYNRAVSNIRVKLNQYISFHNNRPPQGGFYEVINDPDFLLMGAQNQQTL